MRKLLLLSPALSLIVFSSACRNGDDAAAAQQESMPQMATQVVAIPAEERELVEELELVGETIPKRYVEIMSETPGVISEILVEEGATVSEGQPLFSLDEVKLRSALEEAQANLELSKLNFNRQSSLYEQNLVSKKELDQARQRRDADQALVALRQRQLADSHVVAPFDGRVGERLVNLGQVISAGEILTRLVSTNPIGVEFEAPERFLGQLKIGQSIDISVSAYPNETFSGQIQYIAPYVNSDTRAATIRAWFPNDDQRLLPGMFATLNLQLSLKDRALLIPEAALFRLLGDATATIYVIDENGAAQMRTVEIGARIARFVEIVKGLEAGTQVIVEGYQKIGPGSPVKLAPPEAAAVYTGVPIPSPEKGPTEN